MPDLPRPPSKNAAEAPWRDAGNGASGQRNRHAAAMLQKGTAARLVRGAKSLSNASAPRPRHSVEPDDTRTEAPERRRGAAAFPSEPLPFAPDDTDGTRRRPRRVTVPAATLVLFVLVPLLVATVYLTAVARPQYASDVAFIVRSGEGGAMSDALSGFARFTGGTGRTDGMILAGFLESQTLLERLDSRLDIRRHYTEPHGRDPVFALSPTATVEGRLAHWRRMIRVEHDPGTGLIALRVKAFSPEMAQLVARELLVESRILINELDAEARRDAIAQAASDLAVARDRLTEARAVLTAFRFESPILDGNADFEGRVGVLRHLQGQLAQALAAEDTSTAADADIGRVAALRHRIETERVALVRRDDPLRSDYAALLARHERLTADRDFAEAAYRTALARHDLVAANAAASGRYLAVYDHPTLAETARYPQTFLLLGLGAGVLSLLWATAMLTRAAIIDRR